MPATLLANWGRYSTIFPSLLPFFDSRFCLFALFPPTRNHHKEKWEIQKPYCIELETSSQHTSCCQPLKLGLWLIESSRFFCLCLPFPLIHMVILLYLKLTSKYHAGCSHRCNRPCIWDDWKGSQHFFLNCFSRGI